MNETDKIMRLRKLTIHNIASIEDAEIDFEARPLSDAPVFLITGDTGSGKSTILDAICLALYATTPRFDNTQMEGDMDEAGKPITLRDPRQLMRRNTGEASVTLMKRHGVLPGHVNAHPARCRGNSGRCRICRRATS